MIWRNTNNEKTPLSAPPFGGAPMLGYRSQQPPRERESPQRKIDRCGIVTPLATTGGSLAPRNPLPPLRALGGRGSQRSPCGLLPPACRGSLGFPYPRCPSLRSRPRSSPLSGFVARAGPSPLPPVWVLPLSAACGRMAIAPLFSSRPRPAPYALHSPPDGGSLRAPVLGRRPLARSVAQSAPVLSSVGARSGLIGAANETPLGG